MTASNSKAASGSSRWRDATAAAWVSVMVNYSAGRRFGADGTGMARRKRCSVIELLREGVVEQSKKRR
ncbi:hypothetical protein NH8B_2265 [Pseudogulbenkiania sp. NH8B]|nr:hypothetical protein NH8B_2265 [Pseudogulbenkiania sp. NH8B]